MSEPDSDSPFAEFAAPKEGAVDAWRNSQARERTDLTERLLFLSVFALATGSGAASAVVFQVGVSQGIAVPLGAFIFGWIGAYLGMVAGAVWPLTRLYFSRIPGPTRISREGLRETEDELSFVSHWMILGALVGTVVGASLATSFALGRMLGVRGADDLLVWNGIGATASAGAVLLARALWKWTRKQPGNDG